ncbi:MAG: DUF4006 family protein [Sulfurimonas sp.]|nr:DUF4006 family protein [Sulfurimonas sp.]
MVNEHRSLFGLHGMSGFLVATILLVVVVLSLAYFAYEAQARNATNYYDIENPELIKMRSIDNAKHFIDVK